MLEEVAIVLGEWLKCNSHSAAFPEVALPVIVELKRYTKAHRRSLFIAPALIKRLTTLNQKIEENAQWIDNLRSKLVVGPKDLLESSPDVSTSKKSPLEVYITSLPARAAPV